jgi:hypothetical protein
MMARRENWQRKLRAPIKLRGGKPLTTLADCRRLALSLPKDIQLMPEWQRAAQLLLDAAKGGNLSEVGRQFELSLMKLNRLGF